MNAPHDDETLRRAFEAADGDGAARDDCPAADDLWAAARGEASAGLTARVLDHVATCATCAAAWQSAREFGPEENRVAAAPPATPSWAARTSWLATAAMALLAIGLIGSLVLLERQRQLTAQAEHDRAVAEGGIARERDARTAAQQEAVQLRAELDQRSRPIVNVPLFELSADQLRGDAGAAALTVPATASHVTLMLSPPGRLSARAFAAEAVDDAGRVVWRADGLELGPANLFVMTVERRLLPDGAYRLRLLSAASPSPALVHEYVFSIRTR